MKRFALVRRFFSFAVELTGICLLIYMKVSIRKGMIHILAKQDCSHDPIMHAIFVEISNYRFNLGKKVYQCIGFLLMIFFSELCGLFYKLCVDESDKYQKQKSHREFMSLQSAPYLKDYYTEDDETYESTVI